MKNKILILTLQLFCLVLWHQVQAEKSKSVLLINSDSSVGIYNSSQKSFLDNYQGKVESIDLSDKKWNSLDKIKTTLYDIYPDVVYCIGTRAYLLAEKFIPERNLVFSSTVNWHNLPKNENSFGISSRLHSGMELMTLKLIFPETKRLGVIFTDKYHQSWMTSTEKEATKMGIKLNKVKCDSVRGVTLSDLKKLTDIDALWLTPDPGAFHDYVSLKMVLDYCLEKRIPVFSYSPKLLIHESVVISVSVDTETIGRQAAIIVQNLLEANRPSGKVFYPAGTVIKVNRKRATKLGMKIDKNGLRFANEIID